MKRITYIVMALCLGCIAARAEGNHAKPVNSIVTSRTNFRNALWFNSSNTAGLAFRSLASYNDLGLEYERESGSFRPQQEGSTVDNVSINTSGAVRVGNFMLWGDFSFRNIFESGANYNAAMYDVYEDMPYYIMDNNVSGWTKQEYDLAVKMASPVLWQRVSFGLEAGYVTKVGSKQKDPRTETYKYGIEVLPSVVVSLGGGHFLGLNGLFQKGFERSEPSLNNNWEEQKVYYNKGLGEGLLGKVGGNEGVKTLMYRGMEYGGGLQYSYSGAAELLMDFGYVKTRMDGYENPRLPKRLGSADGTDITGTVQLLFGHDRSNKLTLGGEYTNTGGMEYVQKLSTVAFEQEWEVLSTNRMSSYGLISAKISYDHLFGNGDIRGYDWKVGADITFDSRSYEYFIPSSVFSSVSAGALLNASKQFKFRSSSLLLMLEGGYNAGLSGEYSYGGTDGDTFMVDFYKAEHVRLTSDYAAAGGEIAYTLNSRRVSYIFDISGRWVKPVTISGDRLVCTASFGIIF